MCRAVLAYVPLADGRANKHAAKQMRICFTDSACCLVCSRPPGIFCRARPCASARPKSTGVRPARPRHRGVPRRQEMPGECSDGAAAGTMPRWWLRRSDELVACTRQACAPARPRRSRQHPRSRHPLGSADALIDRMLVCSSLGRPRARARPEWLCWSLALSEASPQRRRRFTSAGAAQLLAVPRSMITEPRGSTTAST